MADSLFADVSEWQVGVDDSYPYPVLCIRSNDGTYRDRRWRNNYDWCRRSADDGRLTFFLVYFVWRPNWRETVATFRDQVGTPHPRMAVMLDVESWGGQIRGDCSAEINATRREVGAFVGSTAKVIGYGNVGDLNSLWPHKPPGLQVVVAAYGRNPPYHGKVAHQYTDATGYGGGLPEGAPPFGNCDMNSADGLAPDIFAGVCGISGRETQFSGQDARTGANL
ncbi:hypothetical protein [Mycobacterium sp. 852014-52144_SCH5372336]|uniref:hypothetical protein n=1 Tax=Mycobacterium sp. 852014-52144_SCH5372336 TaxID=1834115 RepID=UPI0007FFE08C|nr:hypothetical protein [Mycobacterium sp. 852014-52144_SCH5372336]OBB71287.1 hypothetical protein A5759_22910 [Mycobacterium sp. 852014-52144_SCH5372336]